MSRAWVMLLLVGCSSAARPDAGTGPHDAVVAEAGIPDGGSSLDFGTPDLGTADQGVEDVGTIDSDLPDAGDADLPPVVIVMIGDGMGKAHLEAASYYAYGQPGLLSMQQLPNHGDMITGSLSGRTDSAASATAMATGAKTFNQHIGLDRFGQPVETAVELAHSLGMTAGIVSTASLPHATPASFAAHHNNRNDYVTIADSLAVVQPDVMLGGGAQFFLPAGPDSYRSDSGLIAPLTQAGYQVVQTRGGMASADPANGTKLLGIFAPEHLDYALSRTATQPSLTEMAETAIRFLDTGDGFFLMIEGARIDMASHGNDLPNAIGDTLAFDDAVRAVADWADQRGNVSLIVTADHECGGLEVRQPNGVGQLPDVWWRWTDHSNLHVDVFAEGPYTDQFQGALLSNTWVHAVTVAQLTKTAVVAPNDSLVPDGSLRDLRHRAVDQVVTTGFGEGYNQLDTMWLDVDQYGLGIGIEGLYEWDNNSLVVLIDHDLGASTGPATLDGVIQDTDGNIDGIITALPLLSPGVSGFGVDFIAVVWGGTSINDEELVPNAGLRGIHGDLGAPDNLHWFAMASTFGEGVRIDPNLPTTPQPQEGWEVYIPWSTVYPNAGGNVPANATIGVAAILVNDDGDYLSNQALPPFPVSTDNPGDTPTALPGIVRFVLDSDGDGVADGNIAPTVLN